MIIKTFRIRCGANSARTKNHIFKGVDNIEVRPIQGTIADIDDIFADARAAGKTYALRHIILAPREAMSIGEMLEALDDVAAEYGLDVARAVIVAHHKARVEPHCHPWHLHAMLPDFSSDGRVADNHLNFKRNQVVARGIERRLGHPHVRGKHNDWVYAEFLKRGRFEDAASLIKAFPLGEPPPRSSFARDTLQALAAAGIDGPYERKFFRESWRAAADGADFLARIATHGITVLIGTGTPPVWVAHCKGRFLFTVAGGLPGIRIVSISARLGEPSHELTSSTIQEPAAEAPAEPAARATGGGAAHARHGGDADQQSGAARPADGSHPGGAAAPGAVTVGGDHHTGAVAAPVGSDRGDHEGHGDGKSGNPGTVGRGARVDSAAELGDQRTRAVAGPLEKGDLIRLTARGGELAAIAHIARLAAEPPRLRVERELTEIEGAALSVTVAATTPLPDPASVTAAKKAVDDTYAARSKAFKASDVADAEYAEIDAIPAPWWNRKAHVAKVDAAYDRKVAATKAVDITQRAYEMANSTQTTTLRTAATAEVARQAHAKTYARRLDLVMDVRAMLARSPGLAAYGTPALVAIAAEKRDIYLLDWKDLWGVPHPSAESAPWTTI